MNTVYDINYYFDKLLLDWDDKFLGENDLPPDFEVVDEGDFSGEGKYQKVKTFTIMYQQTRTGVS